MTNLLMGRLREMSYNVVSAKSRNLKSGEKYFLDANIWINILAAPANPSHRIQSYLTFFDKLLANNEVTIVVPTLLLSEVINRLLKNVHFYAFAKKNQLVHPNIPTDYFKNVFRPSQEYLDSFNLITDDFNAYSNHIEYVNDGLGLDLDPAEILNNIDQHFDFNDNFYYQLALQRNYLIVTDDKDFWREGVTVVTSNTVLLDKQTKINIENSAALGVTKLGSFKKPHER